MKFSIHIPIIKNEGWKKWDCGGISKEEWKIIEDKFGKEIKENGKWEEETQIKKLLLCSKCIEEQIATEV